MAKFKKGDRVRVTQKGGNCEIGDIATVMEDSCIPMISVDGKRAGSKSCASEDKLELLEPPAFKIGDEVQVVTIYSHGNPPWARFKGTIGRITDGTEGHWRVSGTEGTPWRDDELAPIPYDVWSNPEKWDRVRLGQIIKEKSNMGSIVDKVKELALSKEDRLLRKHGIVDDCGNIMNEGIELLTRIMFEAHKADIVKAVQEVDDEEKAAKKGK